MLGHKSATMTLDQYGHLFDDRLDDVADRLDAAARLADVYPMCTNSPEPEAIGWPEDVGGPQLRAFRSVPPAGFEPAPPPPEGGALSPELRGPCGLAKNNRPAVAPESGGEGLSAEVLELLGEGGDVVLLRDPDLLGGVADLG